ncbi:MAG: VOC family protein [Candidatus Poribacteria bacterium]|nr:VOC family protein [Candidatus Poribacteria bacterium]
MASYTYNGVFPIGDTKPLDMPVADLDKAIAWYDKMMGFTVKERKESPVPTVILKRDKVEIGLALNGEDPEQASCYFNVSSTDAAYADMEAKGLKPGNRRIDDHGGKKYDVFFIRDEDGICYCLGSQV